MLYWQAYRISGFGYQKGLVVLRPGWATFLPTAAMKGVVKEIYLGVIDSMLSLTAIPASWLTNRKPRDLAALVTDLHDDFPHDFDRRLQDLTEDLRGVWLPQNQARVARGRHSRGGSLREVDFTVGKVEIHGKAPAGPILDGLLTGWTACAMPVRAGLVFCALLSMLPTALALICLCMWYYGQMPLAATFAWAGMAGLAWLACLIMVWRARG
jgi:hypothetical protein